MALIEAEGFTKFPDDRDFTKTWWEDEMAKKLASPPAGSVVKPGVKATDTLTVTVEQIEAVVKNFPLAKVALKTLFPNVFSKYAPVLKMAPSGPEDVILPVSVDGVPQAVQIRSGGNYHHSAFFLHGNFKWSVILDDDGSTQLLVAETK